MIKDYQKIRIKLTLLYFGIIFIIVEIFSIIVLTEQNNELKRFEHFNSSPSRSNQSPPPLNIDSETRYELIQKTVSDIKSNTTLSIIILDSLIMLLAGVTSYILSGKTLKPILKTLSQQKQFVSDASHELRTPLTAIKTEAEVILRSKHTELQEYEEFTQSVIEEVDRLSILTSNLLDIAKTDNSNQPFKKDT